MSTIIDKYVSSFGRSTFCSSKVVHFHIWAKDLMISLSHQGSWGGIAVRCLSPFMAAGTLLASLCLRIASIMEPILAMVTDLILAIFCCNSRPLSGMIFHFGHIFKNLGHNVIYIIKEVVTIGVVAGIGGIVALPQHTWGNISPYTKLYSSQQRT